MFIIYNVYCLDHHQYELEGEKSRQKVKVNKRMRSEETGEEMWFVFGVWYAPEST